MERDVVKEGSGCDPSRWIRYSRGQAEKRPAFTPLLPCPPLMIKEP